MLDEKIDKVNWCAKEDKKIYSETEARRVINFCSRKNHKQRQKYIPRRYYYCDYCGQYHLTHIQHDFLIPNKERKKKRKQFDEEKRASKKEIRDYNSENCI